MQVNTYSIRHGYDKKKCLVHARCCYTPDFMLATAQYLNLAGSDLFSGMLMSMSFDEGKTWSEFEEQKGLAPVVDGNYITVGCDATPMYHKKSGKVLLLGQTAEYKSGENYPTGKNRKTFYSIYDDNKKEFSKIKFLKMPEGFECCGNGCGQSLELPSGDLLIPVYYAKTDKVNMYSTVLKCSFDGEELKLIEIGNSLTVEVGRGLYEPSIVYHNEEYYMTLRNDDCGVVAKSQDGLNYNDMQLWKWEDGSILQNYNTQQHWMKLGDELYLVYTRRGADNDRVFRHRAPLFAAKVKDMKLVRETEISIVPEKGARLGNFGVTEYKNGSAIVMAAEWMQPSGCEKYGSDNNIYISVCSLENNDD